jgi:hypothetical protein
MVRSVNDKIHCAGVFFNSASSVTGVEEGFMPWLISEVKQEINQMVTSRELLTG